VHTQEQQEVLLGGEALLRTTKFDIKNLNTSLYRVVQNIFRYTELCRRRSRV